MSPHRTAEQIIELVNGVGALITFGIVQSRDGHIRSNGRV